MALALSAHTPRVQSSVYNVSAIERLELGWDTPSRYLESASIPVNHYYCCPLRYTQLAGQVHVQVQTQVKLVVPQQQLCVESETVHL